MSSLIGKPLKSLDELVDRPFRFLAILLVFSLLIKTVLIYQVEIINPDGVGYINSAHQLFEGNFSSAFKYNNKLGYSFLLGLFHLFISDWYLAGKILSGVAMLITTIPLYVIANELFGRRAALYTSIIYTVAPVVNGKCKSVVKDPVFLFLIVLSICLIVYALERPNWSLLALAGLTSCSSVSVRYEGALLFVVVVVFFLVLLIFKKTERRTTLSNLVAFCSFPLCVGFLAVVLLATDVLPVDTSGMLSLYYQTDLTQNYMSIYQHLKDVEKTFFGGVWNNDFFEIARDYIFFLYLIGILQVFLKSLSPALLLPLVFGLNLRGIWSRSVTMLLMIIVSFLFMSYVFLLTQNFIASRYLLVPIVLTLPFVGYGFDRINRRFAEHKFRDHAILIVIAICVILPIGRTFYKASNENDEIKTAGFWLRENRDMTKVKMIVNDERIAYYAGLLRTDYTPMIEWKTPEVIVGQVKYGNFNTIVFYGNPPEVDSVPEFEGFDAVEIFKGRGKKALILEKKKEK